MALDEFVLSVDVAGLRVKNSPRKIFLCGGKLSEHAGPPASCRQVFIEFIHSHRDDLKSKIMLAEQAGNWFDEQIFSDLLELEEMIADLSSLVVLFVESPGSIAELGAFSQIEKIRRKLMVVQEKDHASFSSFINLGPIRFLRNKHNRGPLIVPWADPGKKGSVSEKIFAYSAPNLADRIASALKNSTKEEKFDTENHSHILYLVASLVDILGVCKRIDLKRSLHSMNIAVADDALKRTLHLLVHMKLIECFKYMDGTYYHSGSDSNFISWSFKSLASTNDRLRWKFKIHEFLKKSNDIRIRALNAHLLSRDLLAV